MLKFTQVKRNRSVSAAGFSAADPEMRPARPVEDYIDHEEDQEGAKGVARTGGMIKHRTPSSCHPVVKGKRSHRIAREGGSPSSATSFR